MAPETWRQYFSGLVYPVTHSRAWAAVKRFFTDTGPADYGEWPPDPNDDLMKGGES